MSSVHCWILSERCLLTTIAEFARRLAGCWGLCWRRGSLRCRRKCRRSFHCWCPASAVQSRTFMKTYGSYIRSVISSLAPTSYRNSVRPSVTTWYWFKPRWDRDSGFSPYDSLESLVSCEVIVCCWVRVLLLDGHSEEWPISAQPHLWGCYRNGPG